MQAIALMHKKIRLWEIFLLKFGLITLTLQP